MALQRAGHPEDAREELAAARDQVLANSRKPFEMGTSGEGFWFDWMIARILLAEADGVIPR